MPDPAIRVSQAASTTPTSTNTITTSADTATTSVDTATTSLDTAVNELLDSIAIPEVTIVLDPATPKPTTTTSVPALQTNPIPPANSPFLITEAMWLGMVESQSKTRKRCTNLELELKNVTADLVKADAEMTEFAILFKDIWEKVEGIESALKSSWTECLEAEDPSDLENLNFEKIDGRKMDWIHGRLTKLARVMTFVYDRVKTFPNPKKSIPISQSIEQLQEFARLTDQNLLEHSKRIEQNRDRADLASNEIIKLKNKHRVVAEPTVLSNFEAVLPSTHYCHPPVLAASKKKKKKRKRSASNSDLAVPPIQNQLPSAKPVKASGPGPASTADSLHQKHVEPNLLQAIAKLRAQPRRPAPQKMTPSDLKRVYAGGFQRARPSEIRKTLASVGFATRDIVNVRFTGRDIIEFLIKPAIEEQLIDFFHAGNFIYMPSFDPSQPSDKNASPAIRSLFLERAIDRLSSDILFSNSPLVKDYFSLWRDSLLISRTTGANAALITPTADDSSSLSDFDLSENPTCSEHKSVTIEYEPPVVVEKTFPTKDITILC